MCLVVAEAECSAPGSTKAKSIGKKRFKVNLFGSVPRADIIEVESQRYKDTFTNDDDDDDGAQSHRG